MRRAPLLCALLIAPGSAAAFQTELSGKPLTVDLTETADVSYHVDNGVVAPQFLPGSTAQTPLFNPNWDPTSDNYVDWLNRFDAQLSWGPWHAELRFDSAVFANTPTVPQSYAICVNGLTGPCENRNLALMLENRYIDNFELEKISLNYLGDHLDATLGDFYLSYGRGLVISLLKLDALGVDTTLRGADVTFHWGGFTANAAAGVTNIVNTDEATGEVAPDPEDRVVAARLEWRQPRIVTIGIDGAGFFQNPQTALLSPWEPGAPTQSVPLGWLALGSVQGEPFPPGAGPPALTSTGNFSATIDFPHVWDFGKLYAELAHQVQAEYTANPLGGGASQQSTQGNALLVSADAFLGPATLLVEFKDYQNYIYPLQSSLSSVTYPAFWQQNVYNNPPELEEIFQEEDPSYTTYGPRVRLDWKLSDRVSPFASAALFQNDTAGWDYTITDGYLGVDANWQDHRSHAVVSAGRRLEIMNRLSPTPGDPYQHEWWVQYDAVQVLGATYSLELEGLHRRFDYDALLGHPWSWGYSYLSLKRSAWTVTLGYEYTTQDPAEWRSANPNAGVAWTISDHYTVRAFGGGREAGLRCINGVCRVFPGFTGGSVELAARY